MTAYGSGCFRMNEVNRLKVIQDVVDRRLTTHLAAERLVISDRHCRRLLQRVHDHTLLQREAARLLELTVSTVRLV